MSTMHHNIPLHMEVTTKLDTPAALVETPTKITWYLQHGATTNQTAAHSAALMPDAVLAAALLLCNRGHIPLHVARSTPQATLGHLADQIVTPDLVSLIVGTQQLQA